MKECEYPFCKKTTTDRVRFCYEHYRKYRRKVVLPMREEQAKLDELEHVKLCQKLRKIQKQELKEGGVVK